MNAIKEFRRVNNLSQKDLAIELGVASSFISMVEGGSRKLPPDKIDILRRFRNDKKYICSMLDDILDDKTTELKSNDNADNVKLSDKSDTIHSVGWKKMFLDQAEILASQTDEIIQKDNQIQTLFKTIEELNKKIAELSKKCKE